MPPLEPAPYLRKAFNLAKPVKRACLFASALGVYELRLNGQPVDTDVLSPGWTDYHKRVHYFGYDVTRQLQRGENALGAILGDGWYAGYLAFTGKRHYYGEHPRLIAPDASSNIETAPKKPSAPMRPGKPATGPIREDDLLMGCVYDARKEMRRLGYTRLQRHAWRPAHGR